MPYIIIFCFAMLLLACLIIASKIREANTQKALQLPTHTAPTGDSFDQAREIGNFLHQRAAACGIYFHRTPDSTGVNIDDFHRIASGEDYNLTQFIRICHLLGCEVVIRQNHTSDIEPTANTPTIFAEKIIKMKR